MGRTAWIMEQVKIGRTFQSIGDELNISRQRVHQIAVKEGGLPTPYVIRRQNLMAEVAILSRAGMQDSEIARSTGRTAWAVIRARRRLGLKPVKPVTKGLLLLENGLGFCTKCKETKPVAGFSREPTNRTGLKSWCKACHVLKSQEWRARNRWRNDAENPHTVRS